MDKRKRGGAPAPQGAHSREKNSFANLHSYSSDNQHGFTNDRPEVMSYDVDSNTAV